MNNDSKARMEGRVRKCSYIKFVNAGRYFAPEKGKERIMKSSVKVAIIVL
jgi:hypothetical protein